MKIKVGDKVKWTCKSRPPDLRARGTVACVTDDLWRESQGVGTVISVYDDTVRVQWPTGYSYGFWMERFELGQLRVVSRNDITKVMS